MIVLGLGSNQTDRSGDRIQYLRQAIRLLTKGPNTALTDYRISKVYETSALLPENAPESWNKPYLNIAIAGELTPRFDESPYTLLRRTKEIEAILGRHTRERWAPRTIDIDILAWDEREIDMSHLHVPHRDLLKRSFALKPLSDLFPNWTHPRLRKTAKQVLEEWGQDQNHDDFGIQCRSDLEFRLKGPEIMAILNLTPDSFSDGGQFQTPDDAIKRGIELAKQGASVLDLGAESTRPGATPLTPETEWERLEVVLKPLTQELKDFEHPVSISVDTRHPFTAERALEFGASMINDVSGVRNAEMQSVLKDSDCEIVYMHSLSVPAVKGETLELDGVKGDLMESLIDWAEKRTALLEDRGIDPERLIFDPGIGFGKSPAQNFEILGRVAEFDRLRQKLLIGHSRKSFLNQVTDRPFADRDLETLAISIELSHSNVDYLRVHSAEDHLRALKACYALRGPS